MSESAMVAPVIDNMEEKQSTPTKSMPVKTKLKDYRQKLMTLKARIRYREHAIKGFRKHLKNGNFSQRMKSIKPYPKMGSPESQKIVDTACDQVQCVILDIMIQDEEKKLTENQETYKTILGQQQ